MLRPRIIPCLLLQNGGLVKTTQFQNPKYVGDPINTVRIFREKGADELMLFDIDASLKRNEPDFSLIAQIASECRMPLCYGGGISSAKQAERIIRLGVEKVALSTQAALNPHIITDIGSLIGTQSISVVIDVRRQPKVNKYGVYVKGGKELTPFDLLEYIQLLQRLGVGEIVIHSIDREGTLQGYDFELVDLVSSKTNCPLTVLGGASSHADLKALAERFGAIGMGVGNLFVFFGKQQAVLLRYPSKGQKQEILGSREEVR